MAFARVLVVEEDADLRALLAWRLGRAGFSVVCEADGIRGLATARAVRPEVAVIDGSAPILGGLELCRRLRTDPATARTRLLLVSAVTDPVQEAYAAGVDALIIKPFRGSDLVARVRALVGPTRA